MDYGSWICRCERDSNRQWSGSLHDKVKVTEKHVFRKAIKTEASIKAEASSGPSMWKIRVVHVSRVQEFALSPSVG